MPIPGEAAFCSPPALFLDPCSGDFMSPFSCLVAAVFRGQHVRAPVSLPQQFLLFFTEQITRLDAVGWEGKEFPTFVQNEKGWGTQLQAVFRFWANEK